MRAVTKTRARNGRAAKQKSYKAPKKKQQQKQGIKLHIRPGLHLGYTYQSSVKRRQIIKPTTATTTAISCTRT